MATLASQLKNNGVRPGIWVRPLVTTAPVPASCKMTSYQPAAPASILDPSVPETLRLVQADIARLRNWGYEVIKHDFTTFDITGHWGSTMGPQITNDGWSFADNSLTTAEIVKNLYVAIREAAGDALILGCNTIGHISAGLFEMQRTGDDTSGRHFERTRRMGVNALAFRMPQHRTFFDTDADCVGLTHDIPWEQNRQWLDLVGRSSTSLFVSCDPTAIGPDQRAALRDSFERAARPATPAEPVDWIETTCPRYWRAGDKRLTYNWEVFPGAAFACPG
jgi:alpha-galactosidase